MNIPIPAEYKDFLATHGLFEGLTSGDEAPGYVVLWPLNKLRTRNSELQVQELAAGFLAFGGDGGGEVLAFDATGAVFMLPMIGMEIGQAIKVANSFSELAARFKIEV